MGSVTPNQYSASSSPVCSRIYSSPESGSDAIRALEVVGEATKRIPAEIRDAYPEVPWRSMAGIRDKLIHDYLTVSLEVVWKTVTEDLPALLPALGRVVEAVRKAESPPKK